MLTVCTVLHAKQEINFFIQPVDSITRLNLRSPEVLVFVHGDSTVVSEGQNILVSNSGDIRAKQFVEITVPYDETVNYDVCIDAEGYDTRIIPLKIRPGKHLPGMTAMLGEVALKRTPRKLDEVTVTATKIRLYYKGDTLIYNADAFALPEGSMLDELLRKLDGVTINEHGEIRCNGRKVESLLLEGRNLFDGSPKTLLENLAAYTVRKVKVYEQTSDMDKFLGYSTVDEKPLVMDVNLKKEYSVGKWVDVDAGYGTDNRYLGRAFLLGFTQKLALSAFVNVNNLAAEREPSRYNTLWRPGTSASRDAAYFTGGLSYQYDGSVRGNKTKIIGSVAAGRSDVNSQSRTERENFLTTGNTFETSYLRTETRKVYFQTSHRFVLTLPKVMLTISPEFNFNKNNSLQASAQAAFNQDFGRIDQEEIETIYNGDFTSRLKHMLNRQLRRDSTICDIFRPRLYISATINLPSIKRLFHNLQIDGNGVLNHWSTHNYNRFTINYGENSAPASDIYAYARTFPDNVVNAYGRAQYILRFPSGSYINAGYYYEFNDKNRTYNRYLLNELDDYEPESLKFGMIQESAALANVLDTQNSDATRFYQHEHTVNLTANLQFGDRNLDDDGLGRLYININPEIKNFFRNYHYSKVGYDTVAKDRNTLIFFNGYFNYGADFDKNNRHIFASLKWSTTPRLFDIANTINVANTTDPLNIFVGNSDLRNSISHSGAFELQFRQKVPTWQQHNLSFNYQFTTDEVRRGTIYNPLTGVRRSSLYNVNGSRFYRINYNGNGLLKKWENSWAKNLNYTLGFGFERSRSVELMSTNTTAETLMPDREYVYHRNISPSASLSFTFGGDHNISASFNAGYRRYTGSREDYIAFSAIDYTGRLNGTFKLPGNFTLGTSLNIYARSGYADSRLNTTDYIWNVSASWLWKKPGLTFMLDGYDMLQQIKSASLYVNDYGRTETWSNTLPRYILLSVRYHLDLTNRK